MIESQSKWSILKKIRRGKQILERVTVFSTDSSSTQSVKHFRKKRAGAFISNDTCLFVAKPSLSAGYVTTATWLVESHNGPYSPPTYQCKAMIHHRFRTPACFSQSFTFDQKKWIEIWFLDLRYSRTRFRKSRNTDTFLKKIQKFFKEILKFQVNS